MKAVLIRAAREGLEAALENLKPGLVLQALMALLVASYYLWPASRGPLEFLGGLKERNGLLYAAVATGLSAGALSEIARVLLLQRGRWRRGNGEDMIFKALLFAGTGVMVDIFYRFQAGWFGDNSNWSTLTEKVVADEFGFTVFLTTPYTALFMAWKEAGYRWDLVGADLRSGLFFTRRFLPLLVSTWLFWIPTVTLVYAMPLALQLPLFNIAMAIWALLAMSVAKQTSVAEEVSTTASGREADEKKLTDAA